jgi:RNA polymerase sigma-70 factor (ECF subfamily)
MDEIAEIIEENVNTVKTRLYRALNLLRITMTEEDLEQ